MIGQSDVAVPDGAAAVPVGAAGVDAGDEDADGDALDEALGDVDADDFAALSLTTRSSAAFISFIAFW